MIKNLITNETYLIKRLLFRNIIKLEIDRHNAEVKTTFKRNRFLIQYISVEHFTKEPKLLAVICS